MTGSPGSLNWWIPVYMSSRTGSSQLHVLLCHTKGPCHSLPCLRAFVRGYTIGRWFEPHTSHTSCLEGLSRDELESPKGLSREKRRNIVDGVVWRCRKRGYQWPTLNVTLPRSKCFKHVHIGLGLMKLSACWDRTSHNIRNQNPGSIFYISLICPCHWGPVSNLQRVPSSVAHRNKHTRIWNDCKPNKLYVWTSSHELRSGWPLSMEPGTL